MNTRAEFETELGKWKSLGLVMACRLEEIATTRVSQTMTEHRAAEIVAENNAVLAGLAASIRELLNG